MSQNAADQKPTAASQKESTSNPLLLSAPKFTSALKSFQGQIVAFLALVLLLGGVWYFAKDAGAPSPDVVEAQTGPALSGVVWIWKESAGNGATTTPRLPGDSAVVFAENGAVYLDTDCNTYRGMWTATGTNMLTVVAEPSSTIVCPPDSMASRLSKDLNGTFTFHIEDTMLRLTAENGTTAVFEASGYMGSFAAEEEGAAVTLVITDDGNVTITSTNAGVNTVEEGMWGTGNGGTLLTTLKTRNGMPIAPLTVVFEEMENGVRGISPAAFADITLARATSTPKVETQ